MIGRRQLLIGAGAAALAPALANPSPEHRVHELRIYRMQPGRRDALVDLFDRVFVAAHEALGMRILGTFQDLDDPDHLVWLRSFPDMMSRGAMLQAFYGGPVWQAHRTAANATMIDASDVYLLRPIGRGPPLPPARPPEGAPNDSEATFLVEVHAPENGARLAARRAELFAAFETESAQNNFPRLPVRPERVAVAMRRLDREATARDWLPDPLRRLRLRATARSWLR